LANLANLARKKKKIDHFLAKKSTIFRLKKKVGRYICMYVYMYE
jgi:hypothetical protein